LEQIRATTNIAHFPIHPRLASHDAPENASGANTTATSSSAFPDEQGQPHDRGGGDREAGHEDRDDRPDTGGGDVDADQPCGEEGDLVAHRLGGLPGGLHDPDAQLIDDFQQQRRQRDDHERPEDGLRQPRGRRG
jgi:hypothetical protein